MRIQQKRDPKPEILGFVAAGREYSLYYGGLHGSDSRFFYPIFQRHTLGSEDVTEHIGVWDAANESFARDPEIWGPGNRPSNFDLNVLSFAWKEYSSAG